MGVARAVSDTFDLFVKDILGQELGIGLAMTLPQPLSRDEVYRVVKTNQAEYPAVIYFHWINPRGVITASIEPSVVGSTRNGRTYFAEIKAGRPWALSELYISRITGQPVYSLYPGAYVTGKGSCAVS